MPMGACMWSGVETFTESILFCSLSSNRRQSSYTVTSGNRFFSSPELLESTSATATSLTNLLPVSADRSDPAMPAVPKLAWRRTLFGETAMRPRVTKGAARPASAACFKNERREREWEYFIALEPLDGNIPEHDRIVVSGETKVPGSALLAGMGALGHVLCDLA